MLEALISLPLLSFFALPMLSSYSTSLNLLFFWMTWSTLVLSHKPLHVEIFGTLIVRLIFYVVPSLLFLGFDTLLPSVAVSLKAQGDVAMPLRYGRRRVANIVGVSVFNVLLGVGLAAGIEVLFTDVLHIRSALKIATRLPMPYHILSDLAKGFVARGLLQYYIHRYVLHNQRYGGFLTRLHLKWAHSVNAPFPLVASYDHPLPYLLHKFLPLYLPAVVFRFHILTFQLLVALVSLEDVFTYSGYNILPSSIMLPGMARRRDMHYLTKGKGNFAPSGTLDWVHSTGCVEGNDISEDIEDEMEKHDVRSRTNQAMQSAGDYLQDVGAKARKRTGKGKKQV